MNAGLIFFGVLLFVLQLFQYSLDGKAALATTPLDGTIGKGDTTLAVDTTQDFPDEGVLFIEQEAVTYTGRTQTTFTGVVRGAEDTDAATHSNDILVQSQLAGLSNLAIQFRPVQTSFPFIGEVLGIAQGVGTILTLVPQMVQNDHSYYSGDFLGFQLVTIRYLLNFIAGAWLFVIALKTLAAIRGGG